MAAKRQGQAVQGEVALLHTLKNCLVNLPTSLVSVLVNSNTLAQNVVVELSWRQPIPPPPGSNTPSSTPRSIFVGWTGMQSKRKVASVVGRDGITGSRGGPTARDQDVQLVEIDATFGRLIGLNDGQKVSLNLHLDPPQAHTINIEPLTPADWEMIELHAQFLELNFLSQVRALPNPAFSPGGDAPKQSPHPLTLHLSPTSTANIIVTSLAPSPSSTTAFAKISPDAEVIVAPKVRQRTERSSGRESRSVASTGRRSAGGKSGASTVRHRSSRDGDGSRGVVFLRAVDRALCYEWFDEEEDVKDQTLTVWVDKDVLLSRALRGVTWVSIAIVKPSGLQEPVDPSKEVETEKPATKVVARLKTWEDAPDSQHIALSRTLCAVLGAEGIVGGLIRVEAAPPQASKQSFASKSQSGKEKPSMLKILPFSTTVSQQNSGLKFGGESKQEREEGGKKLKEIFCNSAGNGLLDGPLTDGMVIPALEEILNGWQGGILRFEPPSSPPSDAKSAPVWFLGSEKMPLEVQAEIIKPTAALKSWIPGEPLPSKVPTMVGIDPLIDDLMDHLSHSSSVLLTGGLGAGKTSLSQLLAHNLRNQYLSNIIYFPCRTLVTDETRVSTIKETINRLFGSASWGARLGGKSIVILDDLDKLCPVETELQVGGENGRSRQISESLCSIVRQYCTTDSQVALLATAQSKEALNNVIIGGHVVREIISLKAPDKEGRRRVLEMLVHQNSKPLNAEPLTNGAKHESTKSTDDHSWHDASSPGNSRPSTSHHKRDVSSASKDDRFMVDPSIDFLDIAGQTDGYMPGDLVLLVSRARSESLMRTVNSTDDTLMLTKADFTSALKGFTPASLRNVTLQTSTVKWSSIGGLHSTRKILLETLQYPTTYAPLFAKCPLRLRSGLLLYGYPGCGKTLLASAVASECGLNFISVKGPEILNKYIGASEKSVRDLFERAEAARPCVLFFDEFDSIAPKRGHDSTGVTDRVVNQLLTQMDGAEGVSKGVYILAATSRPDLVDPALLRPGRLDKSLECGMPDLSERIDILRALGEKVRFSKTVRGMDEGVPETLWDIARRTEGYSGADLQAVVYNAQLEAIHDVLGDISETADFGKAPNGTSSNKSASRAPPDFVHFRLGDEDAADWDRSELTTSAALTERAMIAKKLAEMQALRRKLKSESTQANLPARSDSLKHLRAASLHSLTGERSEDDDDDADENDRDGEGSGDGGEREGEGQGKGKSKEPVIQWKHILASLGQTRASISSQERRRLEKIYREFVWGRSGEMPSGQGGSEVGGRTSLM
ncbi:AAA-domain-containing protein [Aulographum hederae CBS 113979]|uniref:Peroxisomal ATPase PEX1 n=1 Tax=Aulographum hederae CBS 113979 TaxID=1176131 RepID=A0A6G1H467_9PEZI|nr:AAA-domain-containing protein [Aulographum hederae CBS 113979]